MALQEAKRQVTHAKVGAFGTAGSGKTTTLSELAIAVSKDLHNSAPVAFFATEPGVDYVIPMFEAEGVKLYVERSKAFSDLLQTVKDAQKLGCCALVVDSITHVWVELVDAFCRRRNISKPEFQHWRIIKGDWAKWANEYVNAPLHIFVAGRAGFEYEYEENSEGKRELVKGDSKMKAEGEFGYEADLLLEMSATTDKAEQRKARGKKNQSTPRMVHNALIRKSRVWELNGKEFSFPDQDHYNAGDYKKVAAPFQPFIDFLKGSESTGPVVDASRTSDEMFDGNGDGEYYRRQRDKQIQIETWDATIQALFPGQDGNSKRARAVVGETITGLRSKTAFEAQSLEQITDQVRMLLAFEKIVKDNFPTSNEELTAALEQAKHTAEPQTLEEQVRLTGEAF